MSKISFTITGIIPSKKNRHKIKMRGGRAFIGPDDTYIAWERQHAAELAGIENFGIFKNSKNLKISYIFRQRLTNKGLPSTRRWDLSNKIESINDMIVASGMISDDNQMIIAEISARVENVPVLTESEVQVDIEEL